MMFFTSNSLFGEYLFIVDEADGQGKIYELRSQQDRKERIKQSISPRERSVGIQVTLPCSQCTSVATQEADPKVSDLQCIIFQSSENQLCSFNICLNHPE